MSRGPPVGKGGGTVGGDGRFYWEVVQERHLERLLAMELVEIGGRVKDATAFKEAYDTEVKDFMMRHGK